MFNVNLNSSVLGSKGSDAISKLGNLSPHQVRVNHDKHFADFNITVENIPTNSIPNQNDFSKIGLGESLGSRVMDSLGKVNQEIIHSDKLVNKMVTKPNSVDIHDVSIALQKADLSLNMTKSIIQRAVSSYKTLINLR